MSVVGSSGVVELAHHPLSSAKLPYHKLYHGLILDFFSVRQLCAGPLLVSRGWRQHVIECIRRMFTQHLVLSVTVDVMEYDESWNTRYLSANTQMKIYLPPVIPTTTGAAPHVGPLRTTMDPFVCTYKNEQYDYNINTYNHTDGNSMPLKKRQPLVSVFCAGLVGRFEWLLQGNKSPAVASQHEDGDDEEGNMEGSDHSNKEEDNERNMQRYLLIEEQLTYTNPRFHINANYATRVLIKNLFRYGRAAYEMDLTFETEKHSFCTF